MIDFKNCYVPTVVTHWGDWICSFFASELLHSLAPEVEQVIDPTYFERPDRSKPSNITDWIELPWASRFEKQIVTVAAKQFDKVLSTHHRHTHKRSMYSGIDAKRLLFFDAHGLSYRLITEERYPVLRPTPRLEEEFEKLGLPEKYNVLHLNEPLNDCRYTTSVSEFIVRNSKRITDRCDGIPLVSTSCKGLGIRDLSSLHGWLKVLVLVRSHEFWGSHSGFTSIASMYRKRVRSNLINGYGIGMLNMGPPPFCYSNWHVVPGSVDALYQAVGAHYHPPYGELKTFNDPEVYLKRCNDAWRDWRSFESLDMKEFPKIKSRCHACCGNGHSCCQCDDHQAMTCSECRGRGYKVFKRFDLYEDIENCLVPLDAMFVPPGDPFGIENPDVVSGMRPWSFKNDAGELTKVSRIVFDPKQFEKYH